MLGHCKFWKSYNYLGEGVHHRALARLENIRTSQSGFAIREGARWRLNDLAEQRNVIFLRCLLSRVVGFFGQLDYGTFISLGRGCPGFRINWL
jgi:hypothetical protein